MDDNVPSPESAALHGAETPAPPLTDAPGAQNGENGSSPASATDDGTSLVTTPATKRKPRVRKAAKKKQAPSPVAPTVTVPSAPLTRPDGTPAPVVHLAPELSPYARTGGLGEAVS